MGNLLDKFLELEKPKEISITDKKLEVEKPKIPKKKRKGISERDMNKPQTLDAIYKLGKESIDAITDVKLRSILEDIKVYSQRK